MTIYNWDATYHPSKCFSNRTIKYLYNRIIKNKEWDVNINCDHNLVMEMIYNTTFNNNWIGYDYVKFIQDIFKYPHSSMSELERFQKMRELGAARTLEYMCIKYDTILGTKKFNERVIKRNAAVKVDAIKKIGLNKIHKIKTGITKTSGPIKIQSLTSNQLTTIIKNTPRFRHKVTPTWIDIFKKFDKLTFNLIEILSDIGKVTNLDNVYNQYINYKDDTSNATLEKFKNRWGDRAEEMYFRTWGRFNNKPITINNIVGKIVRDTNHNPISLNIMKVISKYINLPESSTVIDNRINVIKNVIKYKCSKLSIEDRINKLIGNKTHFIRTELIYGDDAINHMSKYLTRRQKQSSKSNRNLSESDLIDKHILLDNSLSLDCLTKIVSTDCYKSAIKNDQFANTVRLLSDLNKNNNCLFDAYVNWHKSKYFNRLVIRFGQEVATSKLLEKTKKQKYQIDRKLFYGNRASKESLNIFVPIYEKLKVIFPKIWIYFGYDDFREYRLADTERNSQFFYDFTLPQYKLIFEYNGSIWHPRPERLLDEEWNNWKNPFDLKMTALDKYTHDQRKINVAKNYNFDIIELWDSDTVEYNTNIMTEHLKHKGLII